MLYNITENLERTANKTKKYMDVGIHENCTLVNTEYKVTERSEFLAFYFENEEGEQMCHTEWKVRENKPINTMSPEELSSYTGRVDDQATRIHSILSCFINTESWKQMKVSTFAEFAENTIKELEKVNPDTKVRIKVIYDLRNFTSLPKFNNQVWIEPMSIPTEESQIKIYSTDKMSKSQMPRPKFETADNKLNEIEQSVKEENKTDDLPFN